MPLSMVNPGTMVNVSAVRGKDDTQRFLANLGFIEGAEIVVISELGGNVIVNIKESRIAISKAMASRIMTVATHGESDFNYMHHHHHHHVQNHAAIINEHVN